jgi:outer membrane protein OmpA-like peptidoglycan-associated protein
MKTFTARIALVCGAAMLAAGWPSLAEAEIAPGLYGRVDIGNSWSRDLGGDFAAGTGFGDDVRRSPVAQLGLGYQFPWFRVEIAGALRRGYEYRASGSTRIGPLNAPLTAEATVDNWTVMANAFYDIDTGTAWRPYVGAGIGLARNKISDIRSTFNAVETATEFGAAHSELAWAAMAGLAYEIGANLFLDLGYRYIDFGQLETSGNFTFGAGPVTTGDLRAHEVMIGLRWQFGAAAPAPRETVAAQPAPAPRPAAPPPQPQPTVKPAFLVFFDFDQSSLSAQARDIIAAAAAEAGRTGTVRIDVTGHADRSGSNAYNLRLSNRRAEAVRAELQRLGIAANEIAVRGRGEEDPLVATPDGVREPQNRRAEIVLN